MRTTRKLNALATLGMIIALGALALVVGYTSAGGG